jgi:hypothetical protein
MLTLDVAMSTGVYKALAELTGLQELYLDALKPNQLGPAVQLAACRQLTKLSMLVVSLEQGGGTFCVYATNKVCFLLVLLVAANNASTADLGRVSMLSGPQPDTDTLHVTWVLNFTPRTFVAG